MDQEAIANQIKESIQDSLLTATGKFGAPLASGNLLSSINVIPNDQPILKWVREKRIKPLKRGQSQESIAYAIARSMGLPGGATQPRPFIANGIEAASGAMLDETAELVFEQLDEVFK